ncbi:hypothetical protein HYU89_02910 [Candidatus Collierbacteria bacterium]|nr:hypothetical protein [Candidatus Collierbacteria bacterium]
MNKKQKTKNIFALCSLLFALLPLFWNLLRPGFYSSDDGEWMVIRLTAFHESFRKGQIPVRWLSRLNHEYGYPVTNFLYPLPFYLAEPFYALTRDPVLAVKIVMGLAIASMAVGSYVLFKKWGTAEGIIGALTYSYSPYVVFNLYQRGSLGELVAMGIVPWVFWAISSKKLLLSSFFTAALITAHNVVAALFLPLVVVCVLWKFKTRAWFMVHGLWFMLAFGLSAFFWFPALAEYRFVRTSQIAVSDFSNEYLSLQNAFERTGPISVLTNFGLPLFFLTENSKWFWNLFKPLQIIQFPWRLLNLFSFISSGIISFLIFKLKKYRLFQSLIIIFIAVITFISVFPFLSPKSFTNYPPSYYQTNDDSTTVRAEYTPIWVNDWPLVRPETPVKHYYPGLKLFVNGSEKFVNPGEYNGEIRSSVFGEGGKIKFIWSETPLRAATDLISIFSFLIILFLFKYRWII